MGYDQLAEFNYALEHGVVTDSSLAEDYIRLSTALPVQSVGTPEWINKILAVQQPGVGAATEKDLTARLLENAAKRQNH